MTNYYAYRNWLVKIDAPLFGTTKAFIFNLETGENHTFLAQARDTHVFICEYIDFNYHESTDFSKGIGGLMLLSGRDTLMAKEIFNRYF